MLLELKRELIDSISIRINKYEQMQKRISQIDEELAKVLSNLETIESVNHNAVEPPKPVLLDRKYSFFQKWIFKRKEFLTREKSIREYEQEIKEYEKSKKEDERNTLLIRKYRMKIESLNAEKKQLEADLLKIDIEELRIQQEEMKDERKSIIYLIQFRQELAENVEFMKEALKVDYKLIKYDRTNNLELYLDALNKIKSNSKIKAFFEKRYKNDNITLEEFILRIQEELQNPKAVDDDKYKIPTNYLFEAIRNGFGDLDDFFLFNNTNAFIHLDGVVPKETGEYIQELFESKENYVLKHEIYDTSAENQHETAYRICTEGLRSSRQDNQCLNNLSRTTIGNYMDGITLFDYLPWPDDKNDHILIAIPKKVIDNNEPIWGADNPEITDSVSSYVLPQYIIGFIKNGEKICYNPIDIQDRRKFKYLFRNMGKTQYKEKVNDERGTK